jgi:hypothetical protein
MADAAISRPPRTWLLHAGIAFAGRALATVLARPLARVLN